MSQAKQTPALKIYPHSPTKAQIHQMWPDKSQSRRTSAINFAVDTVNERLNIPYSKGAQILSISHLKLIIEELDDAKGYAPLNN